MTAIQMPAEPSAKAIVGPMRSAQRTLGLARVHAADWHVDPHKIGVLGFSAGGHLVATISNRFDTRTYRPVDAADKLSCRPDFAVAIYPGHLAISADEIDAHDRSEFGPNFLDGFRFNPDVHVSSKTPPTFLLQAENDRVDHVEQSLLYFAELKQARVPAELHVYARGGHAFGIRRTKLPISHWPDLVLTWLRTIGMLPG